MKRRRVEAPLVRDAGGRSGIQKWRAARNTAAQRAARAAAPPATRGFYGAQSRLQRQMQGIMEHKVVDTAAASYGANTTGSVTLLNGVAQGSDFTNRIGRKVTMTSVQLRGFLTPEDDQTEATLARVMLVYDSQPNGALPAVTDVLTAADSRSFNNLNNRDRFRVLVDETHALGQRDTTNSLEGAPTAIVLNRYRKCNLPVVFDGTTAAIGDIQTGSLFLLTIGNQASGSAIAASLAVRVRFVDA